MSAGIQDPQLAPNAAALIITEDSEGHITAAAFFGPDVKRNSTSYCIVEQLLAAVVSISNNATLIEDSTDSLIVTPIVGAEGERRGV